MRRTGAIQFQINEGDIRNPYLRDSDTGSAAFETDIINVLRRNSGGETSDARDYIYGVLGTSRTSLGRFSEGRQSLVPLPVDYNRNIAQAFGDLARYIMRGDKCLNFFVAL